jgi:hypothetical protein
MNVNDLLSFLLGFPFQQSNSGGLFCLALNFSWISASLRFEPLPKKFGMTHNKKNFWPRRRRRVGRAGAQQPGGGNQTLSKTGAGSALFGVTIGVG